MDVIILIGRILYGLIFIGSGFAGHLAQADVTAGYAGMRGVKNAKPLVQVSGVLIGAGGLGVILGVWGDLAALGLVAYCLISAFMIHHFWTDDDVMLRTSEMSMFMKNLSMAGGGLILFALFSQTDVAFTITGPLFG